MDRKIYYLICQATQAPGNKKRKNFKTFANKIIN